MKRKSDAVIGLAALILLAVLIFWAMEAAGAWTENFGRTGTERLEDSLPQLAYPIGYLHTPREEITAGQGLESGESVHTQPGEAGVLGDEGAEERADVSREADEAETWGPHGSSTQWVPRGKEEQRSEQVLPYGGRTRDTQFATTRGDAAAEGLQYLGTYWVTGYDTCAQCCGKTDGITASGTQATVGATCAATLPFGTILYIEGIGVRVVEDRGVGDGCIDVVCADHAACYAITGWYEVWVVVEDSE